jgi:hypothetical protein
MDCLLKISELHPAVFQHHYMDGKVSILISQRCLLIHSLSAPAASGPGTLPASGHVILVESEVELTLELDLVTVKPNKPRGDGLLKTQKLLSLWQKL